MEKITSPLKAIRCFCIECMGGQVTYVKDCTSKTCPLYDFRMGKNPHGLLITNWRTLLNKDIEQKTKLTY